MVTYNPAGQGVSYCSKSNGATWYINGSQVVSFTGADLIEGTSYNKEDISAGKKIVWDLGEHIINNPNNYSYRIVNKNYYRGFARTVFGFRNPPWGNPPYGFNLTGYGATAYTFPFFSSTAPSIISVTQGSSGYLLITVSTSQGNLNLLTDRYENCSGGFSSSASLNEASPLGIVKDVCTTNVLKELEVTDGGVLYSYSINDLGSLSVQNIENDNKKFVFTAGEQKIETEGENDDVISLKCGLDCPPKTCFKCRNGNQVCCYDSSGKVIDIVDDPNQEIEGAC